jgi:2,4-dienoyl-CoA reductase-like NADH-dependent reductase (Old Yellow Enzyme family)
MTRPKVVGKAKRTPAFSPTPSPCYRDPHPMTLLTPLTLLPGVVSRNRVWLAPLTNQQSHADGTLSDQELHFLAMRADGGFGLVETCAAYVSPRRQGLAGGARRARRRDAPGAHPPRAAHP